MENLVWTIVGWLINYFWPHSFHDTQWMRAWKTRRQLRVIDASLRGGTEQLQIGDYKIAQIANVQYFEPPLKRSEVPCGFDPKPRDLPPDVKDLELSYLPARIDELKVAGRTADLNDRYALRRLRITRPQVTGGRRNRPELVFEPSNFKYYLMQNSALDQPLLREGSTATTIRKRYLATYSPFEWAYLESMPIHPQFGTVTAVTTRDDFLVVPIRSQMQAIAANEAHQSTEWQAAMSCAEGMLRPVDSQVQLPREEPSPFLTVFRALNDELGLRIGHHYSEDEVRLLGVFFDTHLYQPIGVFVLQLPNHSFLDVYASWQTAKDRQENIDLLAVSVTSRELATLLRGNTIWRGRRVRLFSNHQELGVLLAGFHLLGATVVTGALRNGTDRS